ncbi:MAG: TolC family protein [Treponema sp.]|nr:TolC family protein [Treponema sp.]
MKMQLNVIIILFLFITVNIFSNNDDAKYETLTFAQAASLAVAASADLKHSYASQAVMEGAWKWGLREYFPRINISISENDRVQQYGADNFMKNYGLSLDQLIWDGGRTSMSRKLERAELNLSSSRLDRMAGEIAESAIAVYRNILSSRKILEIKIAALSVLEEQKRILGEEVQLGLALSIDLASADLSLADAKLDITSLQLDLDEMEKQFAELLGLDSLPVLIEKIDINRTVIFPAAVAASALAREKNPDLIEARHSIYKKQMEVKFASNSWIPSLRLNGNFGLSGQGYPLTRYNWSLGVSVEFSSPWFQNRFGVQTGWEPPFDRNAMLQNSLTPLPNPAASYGTDQARIALSLEQEKYEIVLERIGRIAAAAIEKCILANQKRILAIEAAALGKERCRIEEIRLGLGHITRLKLMEIFIEQTQRDTNVVQAAISLLEAERELERLLNLEPGKLGEFAANISLLRSDI